MAEVKDRQVSGETGEMKRQPNQALQTTPMARSAYEKSIEFGYPQRGV